MQKSERERAKLDMVQKDTDLRGSPMYININLMRTPIKPGTKDSIRVLRTLNRKGVLATFETQFIQIWLNYKMNALRSFSYFNLVIYLAYLACLVCFYDYFWAMFGFTAFFIVEELAQCTGTYISRDRIEEDKAVGCMKCFLRYF